MAKPQSLKAEPRQRTTSGALNQLRKEGWVPCVVYGRGFENRNLKLHGKTFAEMLAKSASANILVNLEVGSEDTVMALVQTIQHDPLSGKALHVDFHAVDENTEIHAHPPVELLGEPVGVKAGGQLEQVIHSLEIRCLPKDLPEVIQVDVTHLGYEQYLHVGDITYPAGVTPVPAADVVVAHVARVRTQEEIDAAEAAAAAAIAAASVAMGASA
jgi:large subunit ribosomal protein L25